ncbi:MAG TPA: hypothetical protein VN426_11405 [Syntrophomonadaceae bacterium]|nr:hypothetical protein [Syntrophomonadaceae bacterium]
MAGVAARSGGVYGKAILKMQDRGKKLEGLYYAPWVAWDNGKVTDIYQGGSEGAMSNLLHLNGP